MDAPTLTDDNTDELGGLNDILGLRIRLAHGAVYRHSVSYTHLTLPTILRV